MKKQIYRQKNHIKLEKLWPKKWWTSQNPCQGRFCLIAAGKSPFKKTSFFLADCIVTKHNLSSLCTILLLIIFFSVQIVMHTARYVHICTSTYLILFLLKFTPISTFIRKILKIHMYRDIKKFLEPAMFCHLAVLI